MHGDQDTLAPAQRQKRKSDRQRSEQQNVQPDRRRIVHLQPEHGADDDEADDENDEDGGAIAGIGKE
ncbi:hypothetical protein AJ87_23135 [Rhizobium yanglingense]|nr:hypothetical protein AJ87_23135 [Rhizobium yanglingense]